MVDEGKAAMSTYCKAQAQINKMEKECDEERRMLNERIRTYRSVLHENMIANNLTCMELHPDDNSDPIYVRVKHNTQTRNLDFELIMEIMKQIDYSTISTCADKQGHDLPRMLTHMINTEIKEKHTRTSEKSCLSITKTRERGFERSRDKTTVPTAMLQMGNDLVNARNELSGLKQKNANTRKQCIEEQKEVEEVVKTALRKTDPVNMMTRVHMMQNGDEWVYYLRCKEKEKVPTIGIRKIIPMVELAIVHALSNLGLGREFSPVFRPNAMFWKAFETELSNQFEHAKSTVTRESRLSLDRGAPRCGSKTNR